MGHGTCLQAVPDVHHFSLVMQKERWFSLSSSMYKCPGKGSGCPLGPRPMLGEVTVARRMRLIIHHTWLLLWPLGQLCAWKWKRAEERVSGRCNHLPHKELTVPHTSILCTSSIYNVRLPFVFSKSFCLGKLPAFENRTQVFP